MARTRRVLTLQNLKDEYACSEQVKRFQDFFGSKVVVTKALCAKHASDFNWNWAACYFLSYDGYNMYNGIRIKADETKYKDDEKVCKKYKKDESINRELEKNNLAYNQTIAGAFGELFMTHPATCCMTEKEKGL